MLILASASPRRQALLQGLGLSFETRPQHCAEHSAAKEPADFVVEVALQKAESARRQATPADTVLAADTVVCLDGQILGKPQDEADARRMLSSLSGRTHQVCTGIALWQGGQMRTHCEQTLVTFYDLEPWLVDWYIATGEPLDKAGAYGIQGKGALLVRQIQGDFYNVIGLPLAPLMRMLGPGIFRTLDNTR